MCVCNRVRPCIQQFRCEGNLPALSFTRTHPHALLRLLEARPVSVCDAVHEHRESGPAHVQNKTFHHGRVRILARKTRLGAIREYGAKSRGPASGRSAFARDESGYFNCERCRMGWIPMWQRIRFSHRDRACGACARPRRLLKRSGPRSQRHRVGNVCLVSLKPHAVVCTHLHVHGCVDVALGQRLKIFISVAHVTVTQNACDESRTACVFSTRLPLFR